MPTISTFCGIKIKMYFQQAEHQPPHFHAVYGDDVAAIDLETGEIMEGYLPPKEKLLVKKWSSLHKNELKKIWDTQVFYSIEPL